MGYTAKIAFNVGITAGDGTGDGLRTNMLKLIDNDEYLKEAIQDLENDRDNLQTDIDNLETARGELQTDIDNLETALNSLNKVTRPATANYSVLPTDRIILFYANENGTGTYTLPEETPADGHIYEFVDVQLDSSTNKLTIDGNGFNILDDKVNSSIDLNVDGATIRLRYLAVENVYKVI